MKIITRWPKTAIDQDALGADFTYKMAAARLRNDSWKEGFLKEKQRLCDRRSSPRGDFNFKVKGFRLLSVRTLDRRLRYFDIRYTDTDVAVDEVEEAVTREMEGPGRLLGYRAMQKKLRKVHDLRVPRDLVHAVMYNVDPVSLDAEESQVH